MRGVAEQPLDLWPRRTLLAVEQDLPVPVVEVNGDLAGAAKLIDHLGRQIEGLQLSHGSDVRRVAALSYSR